MTAFRARSFENFPVGFAIFVIKTTLMVLRSQHSSSLVAQFISCRFRLPQNKHDFLHCMLISSTSFTKEKATEEPGGLLQFFRIKRVKLGQLYFFVQLFQRTLLSTLACRGYVTSCLEFLSSC